MTKVYYKHYIFGCREMSKKCKAILSRDIHTERTILLRDLEFCWILSVQFFSAIRSKESAIIITLDIVTFYRG